MPRGPRALPLELTEAERADLRGLLRRCGVGQALAQRVRVVLACAEPGATNQGVARALGLSRPTVATWRRRFAERRLEGLADAPRPGAPRSIDDAAVERVVALTLEEMPRGATRWSTRSMARRAGMSQTAVSRIWRAVGLGPHRAETFELAWIKAGATFTDDGEPNKISKVAGGVVHGVSTDAIWHWSLPSFIAAIRSGRVREFSGAKRREQAEPGRDRRYLSEIVIERLTRVRVHPLVGCYRSDLAGSLLHTLRALRSGTPAEPPLLVTLFLIAGAGAEVEGLGYFTAAPGHKGGRRSKWLEAARDAQLLLARFEAWASGGDSDFSLADFRRVEFFVEGGLRAVGAAQPESDVRRGRPRSRAASVQQIRMHLALRWRDHERGTYGLSDAIRETAEQELLHRKRVNAGWTGADPDTVRLDSGDATLRRSLYRALEVAYHDYPAMGAEERLAHRRFAAVLLRLLRSMGKRTVS